MNGDSRKPGFRIFHGKPRINTIQLNLEWSLAILASAKSIVELIMHQIKISWKTRLSLNTVKICSGRVILDNWITIITCKMSSRIWYGLIKGAVPFTHAFNTNDTPIGYMTEREHHLYINSEFGSTVCVYLLRNYTTDIHKDGLDWKLQVLCRQ